jgi:hypothetical protein
MSMEQDGPRRCVRAANVTPSAAEPFAACCHVAVGNSSKVPGCKRVALTLW